MKNKIRRILDLLLTVCMCGKARFLLALSRIEGLSSGIEDCLLFDCAAKAAGNGLIVEIGCYKGKSTIALALGAKAAGAGLIRCIDPLDEASIRRDFLKNTGKMKVSRQLIMDFRRSADAAKDLPGPLSFLFIDGDHSYEGVKQDISLYAPKVKPGGLIAFHDYFQEDHPFYREQVRRAVSEFMARNSDFTVEAWVDSTLVISKKGGAPVPFLKKYNRYNRIRKFFKGICDLCCGISQK